MAGQLGFRPGRVQELYDAGVGAIYPTPEQIAYAERLQQMLDSIPDANAAAARSVAAGGMPAGARRAVGPDGRSAVILDASAPTVDDQLDAAATDIPLDPMVEDLPIYGRKVVGPRTPLGGDPVPGATMHSQKEVDDYYKRGIDPKTGDMIPSGADQGMLERGFRVVMGADGRPTYMMASGTTGMSQGLAGSAPIQAAEQRRLVTGNEGEKTAYWEPSTRRGLDGGSVDVLVPTQANKDYNADLNAQRQSRDHLRRMTKLAREMNPNAKPEDIAGLVGAVPETQAERHRMQMEARARAQGMREGRMQEERQYAVGSHNINSGNEKAIRQLVELRRRDPALHDKMVAENARPRNVQYRFNPRTGQMEMTSEVAYEPPARGSGTEVNVNTPLQQAALDAKERETNPLAAGAKDLQGGNTQSPEAGQLVERLAEQFDATTGGFSYENENALANELVTKYGVAPEEAARLARRAGNKRRWFWTTWFMQPPGYVPGEESAPSAWGGAPPQGGI